MDSHALLSFKHRLYLCAALPHASCEDGFLERLMLGLQSKRQSSAQLDLQGPMARKPRSVQRVYRVARCTVARLRICSKNLHFGALNALSEQRAEHKIERMYRAVELLGVRSAASCVPGHLTSAENCRCLPAVLCAL